MFANRVDAGRKLAARLSHYANRSDVLVLGIPRGGVPVAVEVAAALHAPLDILLVRKLGAPGQKELAVGAASSGGVRILNDQLIRNLAIDDEQLAAVVAEQEAELKRREELYRGVRPDIAVKGMTVVLVDDGIATGSSMLAAIAALRSLRPAKVVVAIPVASQQACEQIRRAVDELVCVLVPASFLGISEFYEDFSQTDDSEVRKLLSQAAASHAAARQHKEPRHMNTPIQGQHHSATPVLVQVDQAVLHGDIRVLPDAQGLVIFVHGSGSSRFSPRNRYVSNKLNQCGLATLLLDLLTEEEQKVDEETMEYRFDIPLLATRTIQVTQWAERQPALKGLPLGLFGASTGAAAALIAAATLKDEINAVVSRGGRPDLAEDALGRVMAPTLLIVGENDSVALGLNKHALAQMRCTAKLQVVPGATHLFEESGALEQAASAAADWFVNCMRKPDSANLQRAVGWK
jgi:putative phosphoribosyl transferase